MKDFEKNKVSHCRGIKDVNLKSKRFVFMAPNGAPAERPQEAAPTGPEVDVNNPDFDNKNFAEEKKGDFKDTLDNAILDVLSKIDALKNNSEARDKLKNELSAGLTQKINENKSAIAARVKIKDENLAKQAEKTDLNPPSWFQEVLKKLGCTQIGLVHDKADDKTKFKFYAGGTEILFPQTDIAITYTPAALNTVIDTSVDTSKESKEIKVDKNAPLDSGKRINTNKIYENTYGHPPMEGDRLMLNRQGFINKGTFKKVGKDTEFFTDSNIRVWVLVGDKLTFYPKQEEKPEEKNTVTVDGQEYPVISAIERPANLSYLQLADKILNYDVAKGVEIDGKQILDRDICERIVQSNITREQYAYLLKTAHESLPKGSRIPIIIPAANTERTGAQRNRTMAQESAKAEQAAQAKTEAARTQESSLALDTVRRVLSAEDYAKLQETMAGYDAKMAGLPRDSKEWQDNWKDLFSDDAAFYRNAGLHGQVSRETYLAMKAGINNTTWVEMWARENPTTKRIMDIVNNPDFKIVFGEEGKMPKLRNHIWKLVYDVGAGDTFDSEDIIKEFGIKLPNDWDYENVLAFAAYPKKLNDRTLQLSKEQSEVYVKAIEGLSNAIEKLSPAATGERAGNRQFEKQPNFEANSANNFKTLLGLLTLDSAGQIVQENNNTYSCMVEKGGKRLALRLEDQPTGQFISAQDPDTGEVLWKEWDGGALDPQDYLDKINNLFGTQARIAQVEKPGEKMNTVKLTNTTPFFSLRDLETLHGNIPGMPVKELLNADKLGATRFGFSVDNLDNTLNAGVKAGLQKMGVYDTAKYVDSPENRVEIQGNDSARVNVRYRGRDLTIKFENTTAGYNIYIGQGFNQPDNKLAQAHSEWGSLDQLDEALQNIDAMFGRMGERAPTQYMETQNAVERICVSNEAMGMLNKDLTEYMAKVGYQTDLTLNLYQFTELVFRTYTLEELKKEGCIARVENQPNAYILTKLPVKLEHSGGNLDIIKLIYTIKYGSIPDRTFINLVNAAPEKAREAIDTDEKYRHRLMAIFAYGLTDYDREGKTVTMQQTGAGLDSTTSASRDEYFRKASGTAAYNDFLMNNRAFTPDGKIIVDVKKANDNINDLYKKGLAKLEILKVNPRYAELYKQIDDKAKNKTLDLNNDFTDLDNQIIRLGYLNYAEMKEQEQNRNVEQFKEKLVEQILQLLPDTIDGPEGDQVDKKKAAATLKQFPVGLLLTMSYDPNRGNNSNGKLHDFEMGIGAPIVLDVFGTKFAKLVLLPHVGSEGLKLAVGVAFTSKDPNWKEQRVIFYGGVTAGATIGPRNSFDTAISGGIDFKIIKADEQDNYNYYMGLKGVFGVSFGADKIMLGGGPGIKILQWEIDAQQKYENELNDKLRQEGVKGYIDQLKEIYKNGSKPEEVKKFCDSLKADAAMKSKLGLKGDEPDADVLLKFEQLVALIAENFSDQFDLPLVLGGELSFSATHGLLIASGAATGNAPLVLGTCAAWLVEFMVGLNFNVGSRMVMTRERRSSEETMNTFNDQQTQQQFDKAFADLPKSQGSAEYYSSGRNSLTAQGLKRTETGISSVSASAEMSNLDKTLDAFNESLHSRNIPLRLKKDASNVIEVELMEAQDGANERLLIAPGIITVQGGHFYIQDPDKLTNLYFNQQSRVYPLETSHGATVETITTISSNRYFKGDTFPTEITVTRFADNKDTPIITAGSGNKLPEAAPQAYHRTEVDRTVINADQLNMKNALSRNTDEQAEKDSLRPELNDKAKMNAMAKRIFGYHDKQGNTFLSISNAEAKENEKDPNYLSEKLYKFYDDFAASKKIDPPFSGYEKGMLTLELSTLRYTELENRAAAGHKSKEEVYREGLVWAEKVLVRYFQTRIDELKARGQEIKTSATDLAKKATRDLQYLSTSMPKTELAPGTSVTVAIGRGANGLHQLIDGSRDPKFIDQYGYIMGKDYTEIIRSGRNGDPVHDQDYEIGLILLGQLSNLPERSNVKEFMDSNLARKLAGNGGLRFILGHEGYMQVVNYYQNGSGDQNMSGIKQFMDIVEQIRAAQNAGKDVITVTGDQGVKYMLHISTRVQSGIFNRCGNYSAAISENVTIIPPPPEQAMALFAASSEGRTTLNTRTYKEFTGFFGGVSAAIAIPPPSTGPGGGGGPAESAGSGSSTTVDTGPTGSTGAATGDASE